MKSKRILITGASGFIGSNLLRRLLWLGFKHVHIVLRPSSDTWRICDIRNAAHEYEGDITDLPFLKKVVKEARPEVIFHCAIYGGYPFQKDEDRTFLTNFNGTVNLVRVCRDIRYKSFVNLGSSSEYGIKDGPMKETDLLEPFSVYGVSKAAATLYAQAAALKDKKPITTIRPFSVFGPYEDPGRLMPSIIKAGLTGAELIVRSPRAVRDYVYIDDAVDLLIAAASKGRSLGIINLGGARQRTVKEIVRIVSKVSGNKIRVKYAEASGPVLDPDPWQADMSKAKKLLGWRMKTSFEDGIKHTMEWMEEFEGSRYE